MAIYWHSSDGSTVALPPDFGDSDKLHSLLSGETLYYPRIEGNFELVVGPPSGTEIIQVIACTNEGALRYVLASASNSDLERRIREALVRYRDAEWSSDRLVFVTRF